MTTQLIVSNNQTNRHNWTAQDDAVILAKVSESPNNITFACENAARELDKTFKSVYGRYYSKLKQTSQVFNLSSQDGYVSNIKNTSRPREEEVDPMTIILENFSKLTRRQAKVIFDIFNK